MTDLDEIARAAINAVCHYLGWLGMAFTFGGAERIGEIDAAFAVSVHVIAPLKHVKTFTVIPDEQIAGCWNIKELTA